jgi:hypothetical protein
MMSGISPRDFERLSAYLDGALDPKDRSQIEMRLGAEPALASALKDLDVTRALIRRVPQRRAPRNFSLTPAMAGVEQKRAFGGWNSLNLVSAAATLMLVVVLAGDFWAGGFLASGAGAPAAEEAPQAFLAQESDMKASETPTAGVAGETVQETEELELYAAPEETARLADENAPFELRTFILENARQLEIGLGLVAILTGLLAWRSRERQISSRS